MRGRRGVGRRRRRAVGLWFVKDVLVTMAAPWWMIRSQKKEVEEGDRVVDEKLKISIKYLFVFFSLRS